MDKLLNESNIQLFSLARTLLAEPDLINKWKKIQIIFQNALLVISVGIQFLIVVF